MSCCNNYKPKHTCGQKQYAGCTFYETELPEWSSLKDEDCVVLEETTAEIYEQITDILDGIDNSELGNDCLEYTTEGGVGIKQKQVNLVFEEAICNILTTLESMGNDFSLCTLDYGELVDPEDCDGKPTTFCEFAQFVLNKLKELQP